MYVSALLNKQTLLFGCLACLVLSCRKEISHNPDPLSADSGAYVAWGWYRKTPPDIQYVNVLEVFDGELYFGNEPYEDQMLLGKMNSSGSVTPVFSQTSVLNSIRDLEVFNNELVVAGDYSYYFSLSNHGENLFRIAPDGSAYHISFAEYISHKIEDISPFGDVLIVSGTFAPEASSNITSQNIDQLTSAFTSAGLGSGLSGPMIESVEHNGSLYAIGTEDDLKMWNGSTWSSVTYNNANNTDQLYSVCSFDDTLYLYGNFSGGIVLKKMAPNGQWSSVQEIGVTGTVSPEGGLKALGNKLYLFGNGIMLNGELQSNIITLGDEGWQRVGGLNLEVRDLEIFNNKLYAATKYGIYEH
jgi:hypothetical protein